MKYSILLLAIMVTFSGFAQANQESNATAEATAFTSNNKNINVIYPSKTKGNVKVKVQDEKGKTIHYETVYNKDGFKLPLNMTNLNDGKYFVIITNKKDEVKKEIVISNMEYFSVKSVNNRKYQVLVNNQLESDLNLSIYDFDKKLVYFEKYENTKNIAKIYDLSALTTARGFTFEVAAYNQTRQISVD